MSFKKSFERLKPQKLFSDRKDIVKASALNVSSQFLVKRDGTIYRLMPENWMARHVIGLNYSAIGVENIGSLKYGLTKKQLKANIALVRYLKNKYPSISNMIGHHEYREMEGTELWLELDEGYRTKKSDPGDKFMADVRNAIVDLKLRGAKYSFCF
jgi:beta-N-acetylhexosaminidase